MYGIESHEFQDTYTIYKIILKFAAMYCKHTLDVEEVPAISKVMKLFSKSYNG